MHSWITGLDDREILCFPFPGTVITAYKVLIVGL